MTACLLLVAGLAAPTAQDRLRLMPGYEQYTRMQPQLQTAFVSGAVQGVQWADDSRSFRYSLADKSYRFDVVKMKIEDRPSRRANAGIRRATETDRMTSRRVSRGAASSRRRARCRRRR